MCIRDSGGDGPVIAIATATGLKDTASAARPEPAEDRVPELAKLTA